MQGFDHAAAHQTGHHRQLRQGQHQHRPDLVDQRPVAPARHRHQRQAKRKDQLKDRRDDKGRDRAAGGRRRDHRVVHRPVLVQRGHDAQRTADQQRQHQRRRPKLDRDRQARAEEFGHREIGPRVAGPEIAPHKVAEVKKVLLPQRLVEVIDPFQVRHDRGRQPLFLIERAAGGHAHQEEADRHDQEQGGDRGQKPLQDIAQHILSLRKRHRPRARGAGAGGIRKGSLRQEPRRVDVHHVRLPALDLVGHDRVVGIEHQRHHAKLLRHAQLFGLAQQVHPRCGVG